MVDMFKCKEYASEPIYQLRLVAYILTSFKYPKDPSAQEYFCGFGHIIKITKLQVSRIH